MILICLTFICGFIYSTYIVCINKMNLDAMFTTKKCINYFNLNLLINFIILYILF